MGARKDDGGQLLLTEEQWRAPSKSSLGERSDSWSGGSNGSGGHGHRHGGNGYRDDA
jgi:hypothetical protein